MTGLSWRTNEINWFHLSLYFFDEVKNIFLGTYILRDKRHISGLKDENEKIAQTLQIVSATSDFKLKLIASGKDHV